MSITTIVAIGFGIMLIALLIMFYRAHKRGFWAIAERNPNAAYEYFKANVCWRVFEEGLPPNYRNIVPKPHWAGPYKLIVPKIGNKTIHVFGKHPDFSRSQSEFVNKFHQQ